jgi:hypothetical protein
MAGGSGQIRFGIPLGQPGVRRVELRFGGALNGARVDAYASGPRHQLPVMEDRRFRGDTVVVALPELTLDRVEVVVHHHLRPTPLPPGVRLGREVR